jgi:ribosomal protein S18 acetylase RimI-like enzyme
MIEIASLPPERWKESRDIRLASLRLEPTAFGSSYEEEVSFDEIEWKRRTANALFALEDGKPVGTITCIFGNHLKTRHVAHIHGVFVDPSCRGRGIGKKMLEAVLDQVEKKGNVVKVQLTVNSNRLAALSLYQSLGFVTVGQLKKELKVGEEYQDELIMEKML